MEVETGIEPVCTALQAVASPLGHSTAGVDANCTFRADDGIRTRDPNLGKVVRYQLRYIRTLRARTSSVAKHDDSPTEHGCTNPWCLCAVLQVNGTPLECGGEARCAAENAAGPQRPPAD